MEAVQPLERRKACDTCFRKKIKCDMNQPCSNCQLYRSECKTALVRRRPAPKRPALLPQDGDATTSVTPGLANNSLPSLRPLEDRLNSLEAQLQQVISRPGPHLASSAGSTEPSGSSSSSAVEGISQNASSTGSSNSATTLPPLDDVLQLVDRFFDHTNPILPLFNRADFYRLLMEWYSPSHVHSRNSSPLDASKAESRQAMFAAINVVLALSYRIARVPTQDLDLQSNDPMVDTCMRNVEGVMMQLVHHARDIVALQVLLGMMLLYMGSQNEQPATMLIGTAVHLCHRLCLGSQEENDKFQPSLKQQRERLFWLTYILDKDISLRYHTPPHMADDEIELEWSPEPPAPFQEEDPFHELTQGQVRFDWFGHRVRLATIQGQIYDQFYSNRTKMAKLTPEQRQARVFIADAHLENWRRTVPTALQPDAVVKTLMPLALRIDASDRQKGAAMHIMALHCAYMNCLVRIHGIWSYDADWMRLISAFSRQAIQDSALPGSRCGTQRPPLPKQWGRNAGCAYISSLVIVMVDIFQGDDLQQLEADQALTRYGLFIFAKLKEVSSWQPLHRLHNMVRELDWRGGQVIDMVRMQQAPDVGILPPPPPMSDAAMDAAISALQDFAPAQDFSEERWGLAI